MSALDKFFADVEQLIGAEAAQAARAHLSTEAAKIATKAALKNGLTPADIQKLVAAGRALMGGGDE